MKCFGKDRHLKPCRQNACNDTRFCKNHQYMTDYSDEQMENMAICSGCKKAFYLENKKCCDKCKNRLKSLSIEKTANYIKCAHDKCNSKKSDENKYCLKHQLYIWVDQVKESNNIPCTQYIRGCRNILPINSQYKRCEGCRIAERQKDNEKRERARSQNRVINTSDSKYCTTCGKLQPNEHFIGDKNTTTVTCKICRQNNKIQDSKRNKDHRREQGRKYNAKPERREKKNKWKKENWTLVVNAWKKYRDRQREKNEKEYLHKNAEAMRLWRRNNPELVELQNRKTRESKDRQYKIYIKSAKFRNISFSLDFNAYCSITENPCHYCGDINDVRGFHGIDRKDSSRGYMIDNCVPCCPMCNYMKGKLSETIFSNRIETILCFNKMIENGTQYRDSFKNCNSYGTSFSSYSKSATKRNIQFELTDELFNTMIQEECYLCGKQNTYEHCNGIDRVNSKLGYTIPNTRACCGNCNMMKNHYSLESYKSQLLKIYNNWILKSIKECEI